MSGINPKSSDQNNRSSHQLIIIVIIVHEFHGDKSQTKLQGRSKCHVLG